MSSNTNIDIDIKGDVTGNVIVGDKNVVIGSVHGGVVNVISGDQVPELKPKKLPVILKPRPVKNFLNRRVEIGTAASALGSGSSVEVYAKDGTGKSSLLRFLAHDEIGNSFIDGIIYISGRNKNLEDLLQFLFESFYESDIPLKATQSQLLSSLNDKNALIFLDDNELEGKDFEQLLNIAANSVFVLASEDRKSFNDYIKPIELKGLPQEECFELMEVELGRSLAAEELAIAEKICKSLDSNPLLIKQAISLSREKEISLSDLAAQLESASTREGKSEVVREDLDENKKRILVLLALFGGAFVHAGHLEEILNIPDIKSELEELEKRELINTRDSEYAINSADTKNLETSYEADEIKHKCLEYFTGWAAKNKEKSKQIAKEADVLIKVLECGVSISSWKNVLRLGRAIEGAFALNLMWGLWYNVIRIVLRAARNIGDKSAEAWSLHQSGTYRLCSGEKSAAKSFFKEALEIRNSIGDLAGAEITKANLGLFGAGLVAAGVIKIIIALIIIGCIGGGIWYFTQTTKVKALNLDPKFINFDDQNINTESSEQTLIISLSDSERVKINSVEIKGNHLNEFRLAGDTCSYKMLNESKHQCEIRVMFSPKGEDERNAEIVVSYDKSSEPATIPISGKGKKPLSELNVAENLNFGSHETGSSFNKSLILINIGEGELSVSEIVLDSDNFNTIGENCTGRGLKKDQKCEVKIRFAPSDAGKKSANLKIVSNSEKSPDNVKLTGEAMEKPKNPVLVLNRNTLDFGKREIGSNGDSQSVIISNNGDAVLKADISSGDSRQKGFIYKDSCSGKSIQVGKKCEININFSPRAKGSFRSRLTINSNDLKSPHYISLSGTGMEKKFAKIDLKPSTVDFGYIEVNNASKRSTVLLGNIGTAPLVIDKIERFSKSVDLRDGCSGSTLKTNESCRISISTTPFKAGPQNSELVVHSNSVRGKEVISINWNGKKPVLKAAKINYFKANQTEIKQGGRTDICLSVSNARSLRIVPSIGKNLYYEKDCRSVSPGKTTTYKLSALGEDGKTVTKSLRIRVAESTGWCCSNGKVISSTRSNCKGTFYNDPKTAKSKCVPTVRKYYCCANGKVSYVTTNECKIKLKGKTYNSRTEANNACKFVLKPDLKLAPLVIKGYCCTFSSTGSPIIEPLDQKSCTNKKGTYYKTYQDAKNRCVIIY